MDIDDVITIALIHMDYKKKLQSYYECITFDHAMPDIPDEYIEPSKCIYTTERR